MSEMKSLTLNGKKYDSFVDAVARPLAETAAVICSASGEVITVFDSSNHKLLGLSIYGKSTQNGVPTPDSPVDIVSLTNPTITINGKSLVVPHSIPGIPVASGGNYTDANGQQWVCDEVDLARGVYVKRITAETISGKCIFSETADWAGRFVAGQVLKATCKSGPAGALSNFANWRAWGTTENGVHGFGVSIRNVYYSPATTMTADEVTALFAEMIASETPPVIMAQLETPIEIPLSEEELATYGSLYSTKPSTTVTNNAGAYMSMEYVADTKTYIDNRVSNMAPATVE